MTGKNPLKQREEKTTLMVDALRLRLNKDKKSAEELNKEINRLKEVVAGQADQINTLKSQNQIQEALLGKDNELMELIAQLLGPEIQEIMAERENNNEKKEDE